MATRVGKLGHILNEIGKHKIDAGSLTGVVTFVQSDGITYLTITFEISHHGLAIDGLDGDARSVAITPWY